MASANTKTFTDATFKADVLDSDTPVLVDFWAEWCQPCKMLGPTIDALDTDSNRNTAVQFGISAIPTVILFKKGQVAKKFVGLQGKNVFAAAMNEAAA